MLSKDIQQWHLERQIQQIASARPEGEVARILYEHKGKYIDAAAMTASCRVYHISAPHFHRLFLKYTGQSPYQYILEFRVQKAKLLLSDPVLQIKQIGREVGFHNVNHFIRHFKRITGVTPGQYRAGRL